jgi:maltose alpha-D-glucosyltransferase/alpha-amylase
VTSIAPRPARRSTSPRRAPTIISGTDHDPLWYKDAIIYELHVRAFRDSGGDGTGDFKGLTEKLDYLQDLGVTAIWILPFYPSPLRDDGYDIADYAGVHPDYGTLRDVRVFIKEAHRRGLRVITELVCNHTSDQHPWFQRARRAKPGSAFRNFYVWSDTPDRYRDARIIFKDFEASNWTWDPIAGAYYWHRFYAHQPDLNFENPRVREAIFRTMDYWLEMGVDGLRLDAVPYLYEEEGTNCENLPPTHAFLRELRRHIDERFTDRMLLAEANQWPEDSVAYFGDGDECQMAFHFPVMPRMFMSIRMEDRYPIMEILAQTPQIPETAQWALFLRNHDELTLEMVTDEERDYMYRVYASDPLARINLGIRRRLAPLLNNNRRRIELMNGLLFALPGTPVIYYGDEIGMGDNVFLGDRNGVRTPMQWSGDRNAGFSSANRQSLFLPVIVDPEYHYEAINVDAQQANPHSLLWWTKRLIALRKRHPAFGRGTIEFLQPENRRILAFVRRYGDETLLIVANLSRFVQYAEIDLSAFEGATPVELFGHVEFPPVGTAPYFLSLGPHAFMWFSLDAPPEEGQAAPHGPAELAQLPAVSDLNDLMIGRTRTVLSDVLATWAAPRRWFRGKARRLKSAEIRDAVATSLGGVGALTVVLRVHFTDGDAEDYLIPIAAVSPVEASRILAETPTAAIARLGSEADGAAEAILVDAMRAPAFCEGLLDVIGGRRRFRSVQGELQGASTRAFRALRGSGEAFAIGQQRAEQSNTSVIFGERLILKLYRRLESGVNPDVEIGQFLTDRAFPHVPSVAGSITYRRRDGEAATAAVLQSFVPNEGDLWEFTLDQLGDYLERVVTEPTLPEAGPASAASLLERAASPTPDAVREAIGVHLERVELLGVRTAELHQALASVNDEPSFAPEPFNALYQRSLYQSIRSTVRASMRLLAKRMSTLPDDVQVEAAAALSLEPIADQRLDELRARRVGGMRIRCHGDFHTGQVLFTGRDYVFLDFEGEPGRPLGERRLKRSPLTDIAGMIRSFHYAASGSLIRARSSGSVRPEDAGNLEIWARYWYVWIAAAYLRGYRTAAGDSSILPTTDEEWATLLDVLLLQKAAYELDYELNSRPDWVTIPLQGIVAILTS